MTIEEILDTLYDIKEYFLEIKNYDLSETLEDIITQLEKQEKYGFNT